MIAARVFVQPPDPGRTQPLPALALPPAADPAYPGVVEPWPAYQGALIVPATGAPGAWTGGALCPPGWEWAFPAQGAATCRAGHILAAALRLAGDPAIGGRLTATMWLAVRCESGGPPIYCNAAWLAARLAALAHLAQVVDKALVRKEW